MQDTQPHSDAAPESARARDLARDLALNGKRPRRSSAEECGARSLDHPIRTSRRLALDGDPVVDLKGNTEAIETRPDVGGSGRNSYSNDAHPLYLVVRVALAEKAVVDLGLPWDSVDSAFDVFLKSPDIPAFWTRNGEVAEWSKAELC